MEFIGGEDCAVLDVWGGRRAKACSVDDCASTYYGGSGEMIGGAEEGNWGIVIPKGPCARDSICWVDFPVSLTEGDEL